MDNEIKVWDDNNITNILIPLGVLNYIVCDGDILHIKMDIYKAQHLRNLLSGEITSLE